MVFSIYTLGKCINSGDLVPVKPAARPDRILSHRVTFWIVVLIAFGLRLGYALNTNLIGTDSEYFLWMAEDWAAGNVDAAIYNPIGYHPLYPILILQGTYLGLSSISSAFLVSVVLSSLVVFPVYALVRDIWNQRVALLTVFLYAVSPRFVSVGSDTMTDGPFLFFFVASTTLLWLAFRRHQPFLGAVAGVLATAAYLTRVEGIYLTVCFTLLAMLAGTFFAIRGNRSNATAIALVVMVFLPTHVVTSLPYLWKIHELSGHWHFTMKGSMPGARVPMKRSPPESQSQISRDKEASGNPGRIRRIAALKENYGVFLGSTGSFLRYAIRGGDYLHLPLVVFGLLLTCLPPRRRSGTHAVGAIFCLFWTCVFWSSIYLTLLMGRNDSDIRYYLPGWLFLFPWGAVGMISITQSLSNLRLRKLGAAGAIALVVCLTGIGLFKFKEPIRYKQALVLQAGEKIQSMVPEGQTPRVLVTRLKFAFYTGTRDYSKLRGSYEKVLRKARTDQIPFLIGYKKDFMFEDPEWTDKVSPDALTLLDLPNPDPDRIMDVLAYRVKGVPISGLDK